MVDILCFLSIFCEIGILSANLCNTYFIYCSYLCSRNEKSIIAKSYDSSKRFRSGRD